MKKILQNSVLLVFLICGINTAFSQTSNFFYGFEAAPGANDWLPDIRVSSGTNGIASATGGWHGVTPLHPTNSFTRFGGYNSVFPSCGYKTSLKIYLDMGAGWANDTRVDYSSAINNTLGAHRRDFVFNIGFYNDAGAPGAGNRFVVSASTNSGRANAFPKNPGRDPVAVAVTGWYTFEHTFRKSGTVLAVDLKLYDPSNTLVNTWTLSDISDIIGTTVGGNRYGWVLNNEFSPLAIDDVTLTVAPTPVHNLNTGLNYCTIQSAISDPLTLSGHTIEVDPGTYTENVTITKDNLILRSSGGKAVTTIQGITTPGAGAVMVANGVNGVTIGQPGKGFTIIGFDGNGAIESAALYLLGAHTNITIEDNEIRADGDHGLLSNFNAAIDGIYIKGNMFTGRTFLTASPGGCGFATQFDPGNNVPRQLVTMGGGGGVTLSKNVYFLNNIITGTAGGFNGEPACAAFGQGNNLVTIDVIGCTISGNTFNGVTTRFSNSLRTRGPGTSIYCNTFFNGGLGAACGNIFLGSATVLGGGASPNTLAGIATANAFPGGGAYLTPDNAGSYVIYRDLAQATAAAAAIGAGQVAVAAAAVLNCPVLNVNTGLTYATIQGAINSSFTANGHTIQVGAGTFNEDVVINKSLTLIGAGCGSTTVSGPIGGVGGATMRVAASGVVIDGFTITRDGNNPGDWNNPGLNFAGVAIQGQTVDGEIRNCCIIGNRTGIDINNSDGNSVHDNLIDNNHTGMILRNQTDNSSVMQNAITNNRTVGILFLDASGGSNSPVQSAANSTFNNNNISGNWYGDVVDRQTGGSLPAPGANGKNFECNWYGAATVPVTSVANSAEPGYAALVPVIYGGAAVPPGGQPNILGTASANIDYTPWLVNGSDQSAAVGFQPAANSCGGGTPQLNTTINGVTVNSNNDGNDDLASFSVCQYPGNIQFNLYADANGLVHPNLRVYQTLTTSNVSVPFCNNCSATMAAFTGASGTAALINPAMAGTLVMRFKAWIDLNTDDIVDPGEPQGDWIQYTMTIYPKPVLRQTYNTVQVTANNDGTDDTGSFTVCSSLSNNVFLTEISDLQLITPTNRVKVEQVIIKTNVNMSTAANGVYLLTGIGPIPLARTATLINPAMSGTVEIKRRAFYDGNNNNQIDAGECPGDWIVYTVHVDGQAPTIVGCPPNQFVNNSLLCGYLVSGGEFDVSATDDLSTPALSYTLTGATIGSGGSSLNGVQFNLGVTTVTWTATDDCNNTSQCVFTVTVHDPLNTTDFIIYAEKEAKFGEQNDINGDVGVTAANGKAEFKKNSILDPYKVIAKNIHVQMPATVNNKFFVPATGGPNPPFMLYSGGGLSGNHNQTVNGTVPAGNFKNLTIKKGVTATVNGNNYGKVKIEEGATVTFTATSINMEELEVGKGKKDVNTTNVIFSNPASVMIKDKVKIEEDCNINVGGPKVTFYLGDSKKDEENFEVKGDNSVVTLNIMIPNGKLKVNGGARNGTMNGWFIVEKLESDGKNTTWNRYDCGAPRGPVITKNESRDNTPVMLDKGLFQVRAYPNPTSSQFVLQVNSGSNEPVTVKIYDAAGRVQQVISNMPVNATKLFGSELRQGIYFAEVMQGSSKQTLKLLKIE